MGPTESSDADLNKNLVFGSKKYLRALKTQENSLR
jgi:hypothetical protein